MATTITMTMAPDTGTDPSCPNCGVDLSNHPAALDYQKHIEDLQAQVRLLTQKATAAVDKWADYEDEIQKLRAQVNNQPVPENLSESGITTSVPFDERSPATPAASTPGGGGIQNRLSSFLTSRKSTPNLRTQAAPFPPSPSLAMPPPTPSTNDLVAALNREQSLREGAERKLDEASGELEELSTQLFMQANEMVATERKARARLEQRVAVLERRDNEKRRRLEKLEGAVQRIDRVRGMLAPGSAQSPR